MFPDRRIFGRELSREEIVAVRSEILFEIMGRKRGDAYMELMLSGSPDEDYDPVAVFGVFPVLSSDGTFTTDLVNFKRKDVGDEDYYLRSVSELTLKGTAFELDTAIRPIPGLDIDAQIVQMMGALAISHTPSAVLVFNEKKAEKASAHLFYPIYLPPSEALAQVKSNATFALGDHQP